MFCAFFLVFTNPNENFLIIRDKESKIESVNPISGPSKKFLNIYKKNQRPIAGIVLFKLSNELTHKTL